MVLASKIAGLEKAVEEVNALLSDIENEGDFVIDVSCQSSPDDVRHISIEIKQITPIAFIGKRPE